MVFSSITFLFYFLPIVLGTYYLVSKKYRNLVLFGFSLFFYAFGEPRAWWIMIFSTVLDYSCGLYINKNRHMPKRMKRGLLVSIIGNLGLLVFFKYGDFLINNINIIFKLELNSLNLALPIGISFYTFQTMSYTIDLYKGEVDVQTGFINFATYVTLFPQLIAGPIVRYQTVSDELNERNESSLLISEGIKRFVTGLFKKVFFANNVGLIWESIVKIDPLNLSFLSAWIGITAFAMQIYFDFSGYSDMAIGLGKMFGFNFLENFNYPFMATSISDFWRRWHISLGTWFKEYVYIPLGGNKNNHIRNLLIVWFLTGLWHGASWNFILWGLYFGVFIILENKVFSLKNWPLILRRIYTVFFVLLSWVFFAFEDLNRGFSFLKSLLGINGLSFDNIGLYQFENNFILWILLVLASTPLLKKVGSNIFKKDKTGALETSLLLFLFMVSLIYLVDQSYNPFLYFRF